MKGERPRRGIPKRVKNAVWDKYIGMDRTSGKCYACNETIIHITDFEVGHNKAVSKGGSDHISNLRPICEPCNRSMGNSLSIEDYKQTYFSARRPQRKIEERGNMSANIKCGDCEHRYRGYWDAGSYMCKGHGLLNSQRVDKPRTWGKCSIHSFSPTPKAKSKYRRRGKGGSI
jgi:hypothetical protein